MTPMMTVSHKRRKLPISNPWQFLLLSMMLLQRQGSLIMMIRGPTRRLIAATIANIAPVILRLLRREQGVMASGL
jgi:hypothetical protein